MSKVETAAPEARVDVRPDMVTISELSPLAWAAATVLIREGWAVHPGFLPMNLESTGYSTIYLTRAKTTAEASQLAAEVAEKAEAHAAAMHQLAYERDVANAAKNLIDAEKKAAKAAELAAQLAEQRAALQALEAAVKATEGAAHGL